MPISSTRPISREIIIIGGGIIGCCTAYYLTQHSLYNPEKDKVVIIEASEIAAAASGKAGGLLALWAYPSCIVPLSFQLHADLASQHDGEKRWGYRRIHSARLSARGQQESSHKTQAPSEMLSSGSSSLRGQLVIPDLPSDLDWLYVENVDSYRPVGTPKNTAQVTPYKFTTAMAEIAVEKGAVIILGHVTKINKKEGKVVSVTYTEKQSSGKAENESKTLQATDVVICTGPWARILYPDAPIVGLRQNSVIMRLSRTLSAYMLFTEISLATTDTKRSRYVTPEIFTRPDNTVWVAGDTEMDVNQTLPPTADAVITDSKACNDIIEYVGAISKELGTGEVLAQQSCYLPNLEGDIPGPILGKTDAEGLWIAAGHSCWGIQNGPATGKIMSEFVFEGKAKSADVSELDIKFLG